MKTVVLTRKQLEKLTKEELVDELLTVNSIHEDLANLTSRSDEFLEKNVRVESELAVSKNCTKLLSKQIETLQRNTLDSSQYLRREMIEINPVPEDIQDMQLEESICQALSLTGTPVSTGDLEACHRMRRRDWVIVKFSSRKKKRNEVIFKKKSLNGKSDELKNLGFTSAKIFISESMCHENHQLFYRCRQLKRQCLLHSAWFFGNCIYVKVGHNSDATKIKHICDIEKVLNMENIDSFLGINV